MLLCQREWELTRSFFILTVITFLPLTVLPIERERERERERVYEKRNKRTGERDHNKRRSRITIGMGILED